MSGEFSAGDESLEGIADAFYRAEGVVEGGVPLPRRRRRGNAGNVASLFGAGAVDGGEGAVFEGGIVAAGMDATNAMITSATMAQASHAMDALGQTREIARVDGEGMFHNQCMAAAEHKYRYACEASGYKNPNGTRAHDLEQCVRHWVEETPQDSSSIGTQAETSTSEGTSDGKGGKRSDSFTVGGDGKVVKGELQGGGESAWSEVENHGTGTRHGTTTDHRLTMSGRKSPNERCDTQSAARYQRLFPDGQ